MYITFSLISEDCAQLIARWLGRFLFMDACRFYVWYALSKLFLCSRLKVRWDFCFISGIKLFQILTPWYFKLFWNPLVWCLGIYQSSRKMRLRFSKICIFFTYIVMFSIVRSFRRGWSSPQNSGTLTSLWCQFYKTLLNFKCSKVFASLLPASFVVEPKTPNSFHLLIRGWAIFKPIYDVIHWWRHNRTGVKFQKL